MNDDAAAPTSDPLTGSDAPQSTDAADAVTEPTPVTASDLASAPVAEVAPSVTAPTDPTRPTEPIAVASPAAAGGAPSGSDAPAVTTPAPVWSPEPPLAPVSDPTVEAPLTDPPSVRPAATVRTALVGGLVGALVASLVTAGVFVAADDDSTSRTETTTPPSTAPIVTAAPDDSSIPASLGDVDLRSLLDQVRPAVVRIDVDNGMAQGSGTGFIVASDGVIVTNAHVAGDAERIFVTLSDGDVEEAELLGSDPAHDLAVVQIDRDGLPTLTIGDSDPPVTQVGDGVVAVGNALGLEGELSVTTGIVSALDRTVEIEGTRLVSAIQTDAAINPGNSGGPLLNTRGEVIGINTAIAQPDLSNNVGFAISISSALPIIEALRSGQEPEIAFLGVETDTVTPQRAEQEGLETTSGALVTDLVDGAAAEGAGLEIGDVVLRIDGQPTPTTESLLRQIRRHEVGDEVELEIERDGAERTITVRLGRLPSGDV